MQVKVELASFRWPSITTYATLSSLRKGGGERGGTLFFEFTNYVSKNIRFHILTVRE